MQPCTSLRCRFIPSHMQRMHVCLGLTCHLHLWQNDRDLLRATAVTRGWNGYRNQSAQKVDPVKKKKKKISRRSSRISNLSPFDHESVAVPLSYHRSPSFTPSCLRRGAWRGQRCRGGGGGGERDGDYEKHYTVKTRMTPALRLAAIIATLMCH